MEELWPEVRAKDPVRSLATLFGPPAARETILALLLLNQELARVPVVASQPMVGLIRLQWWRDALAATAAGQQRDHMLLRALQPALEAGAPGAAEIGDLIDAREAELEPAGPVDLHGLECHVAARSGRLHELVARAAGVRDAAELAAARAVGTAFGLTGAVLRPPPAMPHLVPGEAAAIGRRALVLLNESRARRRFGRALLPAVLPAVMARREAVLLTRGEALPAPAALPLILAMGWAAARQRL